MMNDETLLILLPKQYKIHWVLNEDESVFLKFLFQSMYNSIQMLSYPSTLINSKNILDFSVLQQFIYLSFFYLVLDLV